MNQRDSKAMSEAVKILSQYYDTVQIFGTRQEDDDTVAHVSGKGNIFARIGQMQIWLQTVTSDLLLPPEGEDENTDDEPEK